MTILFSGVLIGMLLFTSVSAEDDFRIYGTLYDTTAQPVGGYRLVFHDVIKNEDIEVRTDGTGAFAISVPHRTYSLVSVLGLFGETYEVRTPVTITDGRAGVLVSVRLVRIPSLGGSGPASSTAAEATVGMGAVSPAIAQTSPPYTKRGVPSHKKPGVVIGIVLGSVLGAGLIVGGGGGGGHASPSTP